MSTYKSIRKICLHAASLEVENFWHTNLWGKVDDTCGKIFGQVFKQYEYVYMIVREGDNTRDVELTEDCHLLTVMHMLNMDLYDGDIDIYAKHKP
jgi:hypothetical protein